MGNDVIVGDSYFCYPDGSSGGKWVLIYVPLMKIENAIR
jgi:hypothetical protein